MKIPWPFRRSPRVTGGEKINDMQHAVATGGGWNVVRNLDLDDPEAGGYDYARRVGTGVRSSVVLAPIAWIQRAFPEAPVVIERVRGDGQAEPWPEHPLATLLDQPNPHYTGVHLWQATLLSYLTAGNAYWAVVRNGLGVPVQLWYVPHWLIEPKWPRDGSAFISHYEYAPGGVPVRLEIEDVVHFRHGMDPAQPRKGLSPLAATLREIWTDDEASEFIASLLRNNAIPGVVLSPDGDVAVSDADMQEWKRYLRARFTGARRGEPMIGRAKTKVERISWNPKEMDLSAATDRAEERVCAVLGIPVAVVGFSAGLQQTRVGATMTELRKLAWNNGIIPVQRAFADEVERQLLPTFPGSARGLRGGRNGNARVRFDTSGVAALQEDRTKLVDRLNRSVSGGWLTVADAKRQIGIEPLPGDEVYLRSLTTVEVLAGATPPPDPRQGAEDDMKGKAGAALAKTELEERLSGRPSVGKPPSATGFITMQERAFDTLVSAAVSAFAGFFEDELGARAVEAANQILPEVFEKGAKQDDEAGVSHELIAARIVEAMAFDDIVPLWQRQIEEHYLRVNDVTRDHLGQAFNLVVNAPDAVARAVQATAGRRAGLVDLEAQTKRALFRAIEAGRAEGEGAQALADRIAGQIPAGPWRDSETRARVIARTETKHAQRVSAIHNARDAGVEQFIIFDARLGETDQECMALDGTVVSAAEAEQLALDEHPNGTRDYAPYFGDDDGEA